MIDNLEALLTAYVEELEAPHPRILLALPEREMGHQEGEDFERLRIATKLRAILKAVDR